MVKHIVLWTLKETPGNTVAANALRMKSRLEALNGKIPGMLKLEIGIDVSRTEASADVALYSEFADARALAGYQEHPLHLEVAQFIATIRVSRTVVEYIV